MDDKHAIGDIVAGYLSGLGIIIDFKYRGDTEMFLVKHFDTGEEVWHHAHGIAKMKKQYANMLSGNVQTLLDKFNKTW